MSSGPMTSGLTTSVAGIAQGGPVDERTGRLRVAVVQEPASLDPKVNRRRLAELTPADTDLVVYPEAFARDFGEAGSDVSAFAESTSGPFATEVDRVATAARTTIVAGMFESSADPDRPWNTLVVAGETHGAYRKIHLYDSFGYRESDRLLPGGIDPQVLKVGDFLVGVMTCYDLRFPELARMLVAAGAEVLVVPAAWLSGPRKVDHWRTLVRARAIENTCFVVAAGQPAPRYCGHSLVVDPWGEVLAEADAEPAMLTAVLDRDVLHECRRANPSLDNRRM
ncbi:MAG: carbon-nitrogen hydrolase family protein [Nocardioides sp.]